MKRLFWHQPGLDDPKTAHAFSSLDRKPVKTESASNLVSSLTDEGMHAPALDIDLPCRLVESSTKGHYHLFIDKAITWVAYKEVLQALAKAGILEEGFVRSSIDQGGSFLRTKKVKPEQKVNVQGSSDYMKGWGGD